MKIFLIIIGAIVIGLCVRAQDFNKEISLNSSFSKSTNIYPFNTKEVITGLAVSGNITFNSDTSLVRIIIDDGKGMITQKILKINH